MLPNAVASLAQSDQLLEQRPGQTLAVRISLDVYYRRQDGFVSPLVVETPLLFLDPAGLGTWLDGAYVPARIQDLVDREGLTPEAARAQAEAEAAGLLPGLADGIGALPLAVASSDTPALENGGADLIATYRNVGDLDLWGADATVEWSVSPSWTVRATWSHVSENWFRLDDQAPIALNAPADKGTLGVRFRDEGRGMTASARVRHTGSFPFQATGYVGTRCIPDAPVTEFQEDCIDRYTLLDLTWGYQIPNSSATLQLGVSNALNTAYRSFVGVPSVGRMAMARLRWAFD